MIAKEKLPPTADDGRCLCFWLWKDTSSMHQRFTTSKIRSADQHCSLKTENLQFGAWYENQSQTLCQGSNQADSCLDGILWTGLLIFQRHLHYESKINDLQNQKWGLTSKPSTVHHPIQRITIQFGSCKNNNNTHCEIKKCWLYVTFDLWLVALMALFGWVNIWLNKTIWCIQNINIDLCKRNHNIRRCIQNINIELCKRNHNIRGTINYNSRRIKENCATTMQDVTRSNVRSIIEHWRHHNQLI